MLPAFRSILVARLLVGSVLLGFLSGAAGTVVEAAPEHPRQAWQRALADGTVERAVAVANAMDLHRDGFDAQVAVFLDTLQRESGGAQLVTYLATVADPADVLRALLGTSQMGAPLPSGFADIWLAPAPPTTTTLSARSYLLQTTRLSLARADQPRVFLRADEEAGAPALRDRFPALQPLGP